MMSHPLRSLLFASLVAASSTGTLAAETQLWIKGVIGSKALVAYAEPGQHDKKVAEILPEQLKAMGKVPVLAENGAYVQFQLADGKKLWILSEKVLLERPAKCGQGSPSDVIIVVNRATNAARGVGEACGGGK